MSGMGGRVDQCIVATITYILMCPASTVSQAMRACKFSDKKSKNAGKQMAVCRACDKAMAGKKRAFPPNVLDASTARKMSMSLLTSAVTTRHHPIDSNNAQQHEVATKVITNVDEAKAKAKAHQEELAGDAEGACE
jgi:hypothetical protein